MSRSGRARSRQHPRWRRRLPVRMVVGALTAAAMLGFAPTAADAEGVDFIVMVDTSESMISHFDDLVVYLLADILQRVRPGDSVHLLAFDNTPEVVVARTILEQRSYAEVLDQLLLLRPVGPYTDLVRAVRYLFSYSRSLPPANDKLIILLTDGIHDPPPGSATDLAYEQLLEELLQTVRLIQREGWTVRVLQLPGGGGAGAPGGDVASDVAGDAGDGGIAGDGDGDGSQDGSRPGQQLVDELARRLGDSTVTRLEDAGAQADGAESVAGSDDGADADAATREAGTAGGGGADDRPSADAPRADEEAEAETNAGADAQAAGRDAVARAIGLPTLSVPDHLGAVGHRFDVPFTITNHGDQPILVRLTGVQVRDVPLLVRERAVTIPGQSSRVLRGTLALPGDVSAGEQALPVQLSFDGDLRIAPEQIELRFRLRAAAPTVRLDPVPFLIVGSVLVGGGLIILAFLGLRRWLFAAPVARAVAVAGSPLGGGAASGRRLAAGAAHGTGGPSPYPAIELHVDFQNSKIGMRNVHSLRPGRAVTVGGGKSTFVIFLHPFPRRIADLEFDGERYQLRPVLAEHLPGIGSGVDNVLDRPITAKALTGQEVTLRFARYVSPVEQINALMRSIAPPLPPVAVLGPRHAPPTERERERERERELQAERNEPSSKPPNEGRPGSSQEGQRGPALAGAAR